VKLKNKTDMVVSKICQPSVAFAVHFFTIDFYAPFKVGIHGRKQIK
jgi:hypothetical protein